MIIEDHSGAGSSREFRARQIICELCSELYALGWAGGTGGGMSLREGDKIYMAPSGVQKEKLLAADIFVLNLDGSIIESPANKGLRPSQCAPLFLSAYELKKAGAVLHSHSLNVSLATMTAKRVDESISEIEFTEMEMIKGIGDFAYYDTFILPVINNTANECDLTDSLREAMERYPRSPAIAVRNHGIYVWGENAARAKTQAECIDYLCEALLKMRQFRIESHPMAMHDPARTV